MAQSVCNIRGTDHPYERQPGAFLATVPAVAARLLIAAGEAAAGPEQVPTSVRSMIDAADEIMVVTPSLPGRLDWLMSATDKASEQADERLQSVLGHLDDLGADAHGRVGADDPLLALEDATREFGPDHLLIALRGADRAGWQERGLLDRVLERFAIPVTVFQFPDS
jgi:hypothetical protein